MEEVGYEFGIYLPMLIKSKFDESIISISEAVNLGISRTYNYYDYQKINLYPEENCEIDILNALWTILNTQITILMIQRDQ